ncbi:Retrovirus-related Pol polyprotein from transposon TNT 1-94 [Senna tora]|uniref:Retrovirus-related Pol polyprotein from transposon TNT 1-94 n=1 Tax=Senna tora TaxID=362788 RepID=A0A834SEQ6_9FABA|nr:Retrovirus-related Pol polyprotein from transposon TNT 1-94 [Senna tora]
MCISARCTFLGYSLHHKGYKCLDANGRMYIARSVKFDKGTFPFQLSNGTSTNSPPSLSLSSSFPPIPVVPSVSLSTPQGHINTQGHITTQHPIPVTIPLLSSPTSHSTPITHINDQSNTTPIITPQPATVPSSLGSLVSSSTDTSPVMNFHLMQTRAKALSLGCFLSH